MPNKNIKKRKRVVMTSDVVPVGSREDVSAAAPTSDEAVSSAASEMAESVAVDETLRRESAASANAGREAEAAERGSDEEAGAPSPAEPSDGASVPGETNAATARDEELWTPEESEPPAVTVPAADLSRAHLKGLIEALVFVADQPLSLNDIAKAAGRADRKLVKALADELRQDYARRGIHLDEVAGGLVFRTNSAYAPFIRDAAAKKPVRMTRAQLETLAIIAYRQPLTRPEVDEVRGVDSGPVMKMLLERGLVKILGKKEEPGRPLLYGTTHVFLEFFGLKALKDLPSLREFTELSDDSRRLYDREMSESPDAPTDPDLTTLAAAASAAESAHADAVAAGSARGETGADLDADPPTMRPGEGLQGAWFDPPTEPDTSLDALDPLSSPTEGAVDPRGQNEAAGRDTPTDDAESDA